jgi:hypothetical protein
LPWLQLILPFSDPLVPANEMTYETVTYRTEKLNFRSVAIMHSKGKIQFIKTEFIRTLILTFGYLDSFLFLDRVFISGAYIKCNGRMQMRS